MEYINCQSMMTSEFNNARMLIDKLYLDLTFGRCNTFNDENLEGIVEEITEYLKRMVGYKYALEEDSQYLTSFIPYITNGSLSAMEEYATSRRLLTQLYLDCQNNKLNSLEANFAICYIIGHIKNTISILLNKVDIDHCFDEIIALKNRNKNNQNKNVEDVYISYVL